MKTKDHILSQVDCRKAIDVPKVVVEKGMPKRVYEMDLAKSNDFRLVLSPSDDIEKFGKYLLRVRISSKMRTKISLHTQENDMRYCLFRVDFNGPYHTNPSDVNEYVPDELKSFAGMIIGSNHVHYHVQGYPSASWAVPVDNDPFPVKDVSFDNFNECFNDAIIAVSDIIHLETRIVVTGKFMYDGLD